MFLFKGNLIDSQGTIAVDDLRRLLTNYNTVYDLGIRLLHYRTKYRQCLYLSIFNASQYLLYVCVFMCMLNLLLCFKCPPFFLKKKSLVCSIVEGITLENAQQCINEAAQQPAARALENLHHRCRFLYFFIQ